MAYSVGKLTAAISCTVNSGLSLANLIECQDDAWHQPSKGGEEGSKAVGYMEFLGEL